MPDTSPDHAARRELRAGAANWRAVTAVSAVAILAGLMLMPGNRDGADSTDNAGRTAGRDGTSVRDSTGPHERAANVPPQESDGGAKEERAFAIPDILASPFRNTSRSVDYVGNDACIECHRGEHQSYLQTTHSRSFSEIDLAAEPPDGEFSHELSGRNYRVYRDGETLRLREFIRKDGGTEVILADHAARYALGSGNYARMYLIESGDFLIEAPITWYPRRGDWGMSAGYAKDPLQHGFSREVAWGCTHCHSGQVDMIDEAAHRLKVRHLAISCERCHGPGVLHVRERQANLPVNGPIDDSIVNVRHLSRARQEDVCSQCHLSGLADIAVRGRSVADYRPGLRMSDFRVSYRLDRAASRMTVSGQIQQMRLSRCYSESNTMTCATCHNPHSQPPEESRADFYRSRCLECHTSGACGLEEDIRTARQPDDNCVVCHMPRGPTDIPHLSFTPHRIGIHEPDQQVQPLTSSDRLVPINNLDHLPAVERQRLLGLANDAFAARVAGGLDDESTDELRNTQLARVFRQRAAEILRTVREQGLDGPEVATFFSSLYWRRDPRRCIRNAEQALRSPGISAESRITALHNLATSLFDQRRYGQALPYLEELRRIDRNEITLMLLGICYRNIGRLADGLQVIEEAVAAAPQRADLHEYLASYYQQLGRGAEAARERELAALLSQTVPQPQ